MTPMARRSRIPPLPSRWAFAPLTALPAASADAPSRGVRRATSRPKSSSGSSTGSASTPASTSWSSLGRANGSQPSSGGRAPHEPFAPSPPAWPRVERPATPAGPLRSKAVELPRVLAEDLPTSSFAQDGELPLDRLERVGVQTGGMGEIRLEQDPILADGIDEVTQTVEVVLEPERRVDVRLEVLRRLPLHLPQVVGGVLRHLVVERLEDERDPSPPAFDGDHLKLGVAIEYPGEDHVHDHPRVPNEQQGAADRELSVDWMRRPWVLPVEAHSRHARPDVEVNGKLVLDERRPEGIPLGAGEVRSPQVLRV